MCDTSSPSFILSTSVPYSKSNASLSTGNQIKYMPSPFSIYICLHCSHLCSLCVEWLTAVFPHNSALPLCSQSSSFSWSRSSMCLVSDGRDQRPAQKRMTPLVERTPSTSVNCSSTVISSWRIKVKLQNVLSKKVAELLYCQKFLKHHSADIALPVGTKPMQC